MSWQQSCTPSPIFLVNTSFFLWTVGATLALILGRRLGHVFFAALVFAGSVALLSAIALGWPGTFDWQAPQPIYLCVSPMAGHVDPLASLFLSLLAIVGVAVAFFSPGYLSHLRARLNVGLYWTSTFIFILSMAGVVVASNAPTFLVCWEIMSLASVALVATDHIRIKARRAAMMYLAATRIATALLLGGFLWLHYIFNSWNFADWKFSLPAALIPAFILFTGLAVKAGIFPFHLWLPYAHPEAPATISALMSGVMVKVALYAMVRFFLCGGADSQALAYFALTLGTISSVWGVVFALAQSDLKQMLAYHTVENVGLVLMGIAVALLCKSGPLQYVSAIALAGGLFHCVNHGIYKSLLFLGAGAVNARAHSTYMGELGGLARGMPWTMLCFLIGCLSIATMPPLNGFASKWLLYQSLFRVAEYAEHTVQRDIAITFIGVLALVGGLAVACFAKAVGISFLGRARSAHAAAASEASRGMIAAQVLLVMLCLALGLCVPTVLQLLNCIIAPAVSAQVDAGTAFPLHLGSLTVATAGIFAFAYLVVMRGRTARVRQYVTWDCGYGPLSARAEETSGSFSQPIARLFAPLYQYKVSTEIKGTDRRHFPEKITVQVSTAPVLETRIYGPVVLGLQKLSRMAAGLQSGSIHLYLLYVFLTLLALIAVGTRI